MSSNPKINEFTAEFFFVFLLSLLIIVPYVLHKSSASNKWNRGDAGYYQAITESLVNDRDLYIYNNSNSELYADNFAEGKEGLALDKLVPKHPIFVSVIAVPFYLLSSDLGLLVLNILSLTLLIYVTYLLLKEYYTKGVALLSSLLYLPGSMLLQMSYDFSADIVSALLFMTGIYLLKRRSFALSGLLIALSVFAKFALLVLIIPILVYLMVIKIRELPIIRRFLLGLLLGFIPMLLVNKILFGEVFTNGYQRTVIVEPGIAPVRVQHIDKFHSHTLTGIRQVLFGMKERGLFEREQSFVFTNPILVLAVFGFLAMRSRDAFTHLLLAITVLQILFISHYLDWNTSLYGNRFLVIALVATSIFTAQAIKLIQKRIT